jgi:site-specific recombinase XerD
MAIEAKVSFMAQAEKRLASELTAETMGRVLSALAEVLDGFEMRETAFEEDAGDDLLECYLAALKVQGRSQKSIDRYRFVIGRMMKAVKVPTRRITVYHLRQYLAGEKERGVADTTLEGTRQVFSGYFNWLQRESLIDKNPVSNLGTIKCAKRQKKIYTDVEIEKLRMNCKTLRDRAIIGFLGSTGCRISEATNLNRDSVDLNRLECVVRGKGNKERTVYLDSVTGMLIREYLESRKDDCEALFVGLRGERLQPNGVRYMMTELAKRAGVDHVHPHKFRRTLATNLTRHGMPIQEVASVLGHEKLDTTMRYVVLDSEDIKNAYRRYA